MGIQTLLIANRGEIAARIARSCRQLGIRPVGIFSDVDASAYHVRTIGDAIRVGGASASQSYLNTEAVIEAALSAGADAIHPGYGFLSEVADFAHAVEQAGLIFVGPTPQTLELFGDKGRAKAAASALGVPTIPGSEHALVELSAIVEKIHETGLPIILKAVGGGGGRGQRLIESESQIEEAVESALREARQAFNSEGLLLERFVPRARHVEIQIAGDGCGEVVHLFERDCSLQRRHQKVIEEAPSPGLERERIERIAGGAARLGEHLNYRGLGTVEFLVTDDAYYFLEVNPRLQVEHPVTEAITGIDLVGLHLQIAAGEDLGLRQDEITLAGHAIEARIYAEQPGMNFAPSTGRLTELTLPANLRVDAGVGIGDTVTPYYDPMIAKLIAHAPNRDIALAQLADGLKRSTIRGIETNLDFLSALLARRDVRAGAVHTRLIDQDLASLIDDDESDMNAELALLASVAVCLWLSRGRTSDGGDLWTHSEYFADWRLCTDDNTVLATPRVLVGFRDQEIAAYVSSKSVTGEISVRLGAHAPSTIMLEALPGARWRVSCDSRVTIVEGQATDTTVTLSGPTQAATFGMASPLAVAEAVAESEDAVHFPLTGAIVKLSVTEGQAVKAGDTLAILESMKMEIPIKAPKDGIIAQLTWAVEDTVERGQMLLELSDQQGNPTDG